jgi:hypothetical protein
MADDRLACCRSASIARTNLRRGPAVKWEDHRNLRLRPAAPAKNRGRLQRQVARACIVAGTQIVSSSTFYAWAYAGKKAAR